MKSKDLSAERGSWRAEFLVSNFSSVPFTEVTAFRHGAPVYNETHRQATEFAARFLIGTSYPCWVESVEPPWRVAMEPVRQGPSRADTDLAIMSSLLLAVSAFSLIVTLVSVVKKLAAGVSSVSFAAGDVAAPDGAAREALSAAQIEKLCTVKGEGEQGDRVETEVCAICLDDDEEMANAVTLPCRHPFHAACIRAWLQRGGVKCPLCCYKLDEAFDGSGDEYRDSGEESTAEEGRSGSREGDGEATDGDRQIPGRVGPAGNTSSADIEHGVGREVSARANSHGGNRRLESEGCSEVGLD